MHSCFQETGKEVQYFGTKISRDIEIDLSSVDLNLISIEMDSIIGEGLANKDICSDIIDNNW